MVTHSDSTLGAMLAFIMMSGVFIGLLSATAHLVCKEFRTAAKALLVSAVLAGTYLAALIAVSLFTPQKIVNVGDGYCVDIWCIGIENVNATPRGREMVYKVDVRIFSDANHVNTSAKGASLYLLDERGRRFPLVNDPSVTGFDMTLAPGQSIHTALTFVTAEDVRQLFLTGDGGARPPFWVRLYFGSDDSLFHKRTLLRVL